MKTAALLLVLLAQSAPENVLYVVDKVQQESHHNSYGSAANSLQGEHHTAPVVMAEFSKRCPEVSFTKVQENADLILETQPGASVLSDQKGNILYTSPAKTLSNMVKDVCRFANSHKAACSVSSA